MAVERRFHQDGGGDAFWSFCVEFLDIQEPGDPGVSGGAKVDYKEVLSPADFAVFSKLRAVRKEAAEAEKLPPFALFNNEQLAEMVQKRVANQEQLGAIRGIGESRLAKYGALVLKILEEAYGSKSSSQEASSPKGEARLS